MQCKNHPDRQAVQFCADCGIPLCKDCAEEAKPGAYYCFKCAMLTSVSEVGTTIKDKREKSAEKKEKAKEKKKWTPFRYFVVVSSVLILVMWGVILFGGQKPPSGTADFANQPRVLLFMVDGALKRFAHYEGSQYPAKLIDLMPKYLNLRKEEVSYLGWLVYERDPEVGYRLSLGKSKAGGMNLIITPKGIRYGST